MPDDPYAAFSEPVKKPQGKTSESTLNEQRVPLVSAKDPYGDFAAPVRAAQKPPKPSPALRGPALMQPGVIDSRPHGNAPITPMAISPGTSTPLRMVPLTGAQVGSMAGQMVRPTPPGQGAQFRNAPRGGQFTDIPHPSDPNLVQLRNAPGVYVDVSKIHVPPQLSESAKRALVAETGIDVPIPTQRSKPLTKQQKATQQARAETIRAAQQGRRAEVTGPAYSPQDVGSVGEMMTTPLGLGREFAEQMTPQGTGLPSAAGRALMGATTPASALFMAGAGVAGALSPVASRLVSAGFSVDMIRSAVDAAQEGKGWDALISAGMGGAAGLHALHGTPVERAGEDTHDNKGVIVSRGKEPEVLTNNGHHTPLDETWVPLKGVTDDASISSSSFEKTGPQAVRPGAGGEARPRRSPRKSAGGQESARRSEEPATAGQAQDEGRQEAQAEGRTAGEVAKEPWMMTRAEFVAANRSPNIHQKSMAESVHRASVKNAVREGKPVPASVLADYPDLAAQHTQAHPPLTEPAPFSIRRTDAGREVGGQEEAKPAPIIGYHVTTQSAADKIAGEGFRGSPFRGVTKAGEYDESGVVFTYPSLEALHNELEMWGENPAVLEVRGKGFDWRNTEAYNPEQPERVFPVKSVTSFRRLNPNEWQQSPQVANAMHPATSPPAEGERAAPTEDLLSEFHALNQEFNRVAGKDVARAHDIADRLSVVRRSLFKAGIENPEVHTPPTGDPATLRKEIAAIQKRIDTINANRKTPGEGGSRAQTTTANANVGRLVDVLNAKKEQLRSLEETPPAHPKGEAPAPAQAPAETPTPRQARLAEIQAERAAIREQMKKSAGVKGKEAGATLGPEDWNLLLRDARFWIEEHGLKFAEWAADVRENLHERFHEHLERAWAAATGKQEQAGRKPLWEMSQEELDRAHEEARGTSQAQEEEFFGPEGAKRYRSLRRIAESSTRSFAETEAASREMEQMEATLSEKERNRFFGIGEDILDPDEVRDYQRALGNLDYDSPEALGRSLRHAITKVGEGNDPAEMSHTERLAYAQMRAGFEYAKSQGWDTGPITQEAIKGAVERFGDPHKPLSDPVNQDAALMLRRFISSPEDTAPTPPAPKALPAATTKPARVDEPSGETTGIAERVQRRMADEGRAAPYQPGVGTTPEASIEAGRARLRAGEDPEAHLSMMEARGPEVSGADMAFLRAQHEALSRATDRAIDEHGYGSPQWKAAFDKEQVWYKRISPYRTEFQKLGVSMQGETEVDTGSFHALARAFSERTGREMTPAERTQAEGHAARVKALEEQLSAAQGKLDEAIKRLEQKAPAQEKAGSKKLPTDAKGLAEHFAKRKADDSLYSSAVMRSKEAGAVRRPGAPPNFTAEEVRAIWDYAKQYIGMGNVGTQRTFDFTDVVSKVARDLGLEEEEVVHAFTMNKAVPRAVVDDMYRVSSLRRRAVTQAKMWLEDARTPGYARFLRFLNEMPRAAAVFGHGTVGMVTHAGPNVFRPTSWRAYWPSFFKQWAVFLGKPGMSSRVVHEHMLKSIENEPLFTMKLRSGLKIDPNKVYDSWQTYARYLGQVGAKVGEIAQRGDRGMDVLKLFRSRYFDLEWNRLPKELQTPDMAKELANWVNHASGAGEMPIKEAEPLMFASSLEAARWARTVGDPIRTAKTYADVVLNRGRNTSVEERAIANLRVKRALELSSVFLGALAVNYGLQKAGGQEDTVNFNDPTKTDWLKFKWNGKTFDPTGGSTAPIHFLAAVLAHVKASDLRGVGSDAAYYAAGKVTPSIGIGMDVAFRKNVFTGRPMPFAEDTLKAKAARSGKQPYSYGELAWEHSPIPAAGVAREYYASLQKGGADADTAKAFVDAVWNLPAEMIGVRVGQTPQQAAPVRRARRAHRESDNANPYGSTSDYNPRAVYNSR